MNRPCWPFEDENPLHTILSDMGHLNDGTLVHKAMAHMQALCVAHAQWHRVVIPSMTAYTHMLTNQEIVQMHTWLCQILCDFWFIKPRIFGYTRNWPGMQILLTSHQDLAAVKLVYGEFIRHVSTWDSEQMLDYWQFIMLRNFSQNA